MVRKYLCPSVVETKNDPQTSIWTRSKRLTSLLLSKGNGSLFCLAKGQMLQSLVQQCWRKERTWLKEWIFISDGCPSLECHNEYKLACESKEEKTVKEFNRPKTNWPLVMT